MLKFQRRNYNVKFNHADGSGPVNCPADAMVFPNMGPDFEAFCNLHFAGVTPDQRASIASLFLRQVEDKAIVAAIHRKEAPALSFGLAATEVLHAWQNIAAARESESKPNDTK